ncbi:hypothetical protein V7S43_001811 [Phytophthora oleae]|uniref:C2H2-type domain-containing protein n=1 Tax=Phytophthora oleae TaxID=2107226 RepID=A0ABD3G1T9_9STRA
MPKRVHCEAMSSSDADENSPPAKITKSTSMCEYCSKTFTSRGMALHQKKCRKKLSHAKNEAKKTRSYKFCILNEYIYEEILSFLSNQTLTKMQMITGDSYDGCEPELAKICCRCENDNFSIGSPWCQQCLPEKWPYYNRERVTKKKAMKIYGVKEKDLATVPYKRRSGRCLYKRATLDDFIQETCGSKKEWLRHLVKVRARWEKAKAVERRRKDVCNFLLVKAPELARSVNTIHKLDLNMEDKDQWYPRFEDLEAACEDGGLSLPIVLGSTLCKDFLKNGIGSVEDVVNGIQQS